MWNKDLAHPKCVVGFGAIQSQQEPASAAYRFRLDLQSSGGERKDSFMCYCN